MKKYENYASALEALSKASDQDLNNEFVQSGVISKFSMQFELGWKLLKVLLAYEGDPVSASGSPRDILKTAIQYYTFLDEEMWLRMLRDRNDTNHNYNGKIARELVDTIINDYIPEFERMQAGLLTRYGKTILEA